MRAGNLFSLAVNSWVLAVISAVFSEILAPREISVGVNCCLFASSLISVFNCRISPFNSRISPFNSWISSGVVIASQFHRFAKSSKSRNVKSGFPNAKGMFKKQYFIPLSQVKWIQISKSLKKLTLGRFWEGKSKCRKQTDFHR